MSNKLIKAGGSTPAETLTPFTFAGTGRTVQIRKLSALIRDEIRRAVTADPAYAKPEPPMVDVDYGNGVLQQANFGHPVYVQRLQDWNTRVANEVGERLTNLVVRRAIVADIDATAVAAMRDDMSAIGATLDAYTDHEVYVRFVCVGPMEDWKDCLAAVFQRSAPTEEAVQAHIDSFRADVRREEPLPSES